MLEDTGERYMPQPGDAHYEHPHRYLLARHFAAGGIVADLASGEGYGASWLAESANCVFGLDIAEDAVLHAASRYRTVHPNLSFARAALERLPLSEGSCDLITCFEAIEHVHDPKSVVAEIAGALAPTGVAIISTPNKHVHTDMLGIQNPYHFSEMYLDEFQELLGSFFETVVVLGQRTIAASWAWPLEREGAERSELLVAPDLGRLPDTDASLEPMYALAYCTNGRADLRGELAATSLLVDQDLSLLGYYDRAADTANHLKVVLDSVEAARVALAESVSRADHRAAMAEAELAAVQGSRVMRYTKALRGGYSWLRHLSGARGSQRPH
jgi:SAM-dependent methyltransferase